MQAALIPNCIPYDPTFAYEVAVIVREGIRRMYTEHEDVYYYMTLLNENYAHPEMPEGSEHGILKGLHPTANTRQQRPRTAHGLRLHPDGSHRRR